MKKKLIYSLYTDEISSSTSTPDFKRQQFEKYKDSIIETQKQYALLCGADYELFSPTEYLYDLIQFEKIYKFKELLEIYDEVLYLDFDVIPHTNISFFDNHDIENKVCCHGLIKNIEKNFDSHSHFHEKLHDHVWYYLDMFNKVCCKKAMLIVENCSGNDTIINTGVIGLSKKTVDLLCFEERKKECDNIFEECLIDNLFPYEIYSTWKPNNEVYFSYLIERYNIPMDDIGIQWNFILDKSHPEFSNSAQLVHHVNKHFELSFKNVDR